jgi:uncharacterized protein involved in response to NO
VVQGALKLILEPIFEADQPSMIGLIAWRFRSIQLIYLAALVAAVVRIAVAFGLMREPMLHLSATAWVAAFGGFVVIYAPLLCITRRA